MTTPEQIIAKIEEIEKLSTSTADIYKNIKDALDYSDALLYFKQTAIRVFNLPTADPPEGSPGQEDMKG